MNNINDYLAELKIAMQDCDAATLQDALADAEDHLRTALESAGEEKPGAIEEDVLKAIIEEYGSPEEVASAYREIEKRLPPALAPDTRTNNRSLLGRFFGVAADPRAWGALVYMLISLLTGILYFTWAVTGLSLSLGLIVLIIGVPFIALFMLSVRGIALVEGRIVEALLGVRMPRKSVFVDKNKGWWERLKDLVFSKLAWKTMVYMIVMMPLGIVYFTLIISLMSVGLALVAAPFAQSIFHFAVITIGLTQYQIPAWGFPLWIATGIVLIFATMHLAKLVGRMQGWFARQMLVVD
jgi:hypothetical protein